MKEIKRLFLIALVFVFSFVAVACDNTSDFEFKLDDKFNATVEMKVGDELEVKYQLTDGATLSWKSSDEQVAFVANDVLKAVGEGEATISVSVKEDSSLKASFKVKVTKDSEETNYSLTLTASQNSVEVGSSVTISPALSPASNDATFAWSVNNDNASIKDGVVTALKSGDVLVSCA